MSIPEMERAALAGSPEFQTSQPHQLSEAAANLQAEKLRRLYSFCKAAACTVAHLAFGVCR